MTIPIIIFLSASLYAFFDYYKTKESKDLIFGLILLAGAVATFFQTLNNNTQTDNIEKLSKLDTSLSHHIDILASIDTSISSSTNGLVNRIIILSRQNIDLSDSIKILDSIVYTITKKINKLSDSTNSLANKLDIKTDQEFAVSGQLYFLLNHRNNNITFIYGDNNFSNPISYYKNKSMLGQGFIGGDPALFIDPIYFFIRNDSMLISCKLHSPDGDLIFESENNNWRTNKFLIGKFNFDNKGIEIFDRRGFIFLSLNILSDNSIQINRVIYNGDRVTILSSGGITNIPLSDLKRYFSAHPYKPLFKYTGDKWHGVRN